MSRSRYIVTAFSRNDGSIASEYTIAKTKIQIVESYKDLGVIFDSKLNFKLKYEMVC